VSSNHIALIPAAGVGARFGNTQPKQYARLGARTMLEHATFALLADARIGTVYVVVSPGDEAFSRIDWREHASRVVALYCGGPSRAASVHNGLVAIGDAVELDDWVLVHDAARPCLPLADLHQLIDTLADDEVGGLLAVPLADTLKRADDAGRIERTEPRDGLWRALTPQMFRYGVLLRALSYAASDALERYARVTDEASAVEAIGMRPRLIAGSGANIKVTVPQDVHVAARLLGLQDAGP
jgi:2-C-methyl-D-erythritol 4-phosphate cytidylyltransferase